MKKRTTVKEQISAEKELLSEKLKAITATHTQRMEVAILMGTSLSTVERYLSGNVGGLETAREMLRLLTSVTALKA